MGFDSTSLMAAIWSISNSIGYVSVYLLIGVVPCFLWLLFYALQDRHPEPKKEILAVFALGAFMTAPAVAIEIFLINTIDSFNLPAIISTLASNIIAVAFVEEFVKYAAVWLKEQAISQNRQLDEPVDFVIYMIASAMGFAAVENILFLLMPGPDPLIMRSMYRSVSAILLHTLCSGVMGYYMAKAFCDNGKKISLLATGFVTVSCLHGLYNFSIMKSEGDLSYLFIPLVIIMTLAFTLYVQFQQLLKTKSVCNMKITKKTIDR